MWACLAGDNFQRVFSSGDGIIYAITPDGSLVWYKLCGIKKDGAPVDCNRYVGARDLCFKSGVSVWEGPKQIRGAWSDFLRVFALL